MKLKAEYDTGATKLRTKETEVNSVHEAAEWLADIVWESTIRFYKDSRFWYENKVWLSIDDKEPFDVGLDMFFGSVSLRFDEDYPDTIWVYNQYEDTSEEYNDEKEALTYWIENDVYELYD